MEMKLLGIRFRVEIVIACLIVGIIAGGHVFCSCVHTESAKKVVKEGMRTLGAKLEHSMSDGVKGSWGNERNVETVSQHLDTNQGPILPLPPGQLSFFAQNEFSSECCVSPFSGASSSGGCACVTEEQVKYINGRGGNNTSNHGI